MQKKEEELPNRPPDLLSGPKISIELSLVEGNVGPSQVPEPDPPISHCISPQALPYRQSQAVRATNIVICN